MADVIDDRGDARVAAPQGLGQDALHLREVAGDGCIQVCGGVGRTRRGH